MVDLVYQSSPRSFGSLKKGVEGLFYIKCWAEGKYADTLQCNERWFNMFKMHRISLFFFFVYGTCEILIDRLDSSLPPLS